MNGFGYTEFLLCFLVYMCTVLVYEQMWFVSTVLSTLILFFRKQMV
jgi:hypothetical protein